MIFEPTNIIPSTLTGTGTIQSSDNVSVQWQLNGNSALEAYQIDVMQNNTDSTLVHSTGVISDGCPAYGRDRLGNTVMFTYTPYNTTWASWGLSDGNNYKFKITQWFAEVSQTFSLTLSSNLTQNQSYYYAVQIGQQLSHVAYIGFTVSDPDLFVNGTTLYYSLAYRTGWLVQPEGVNNQRTVPYIFSYNESAPEGDNLGQATAVVSDGTFYNEFFTQQNTAVAFITRTNPTLTLALTDEYGTPLQTTTLTKAEVYATGTYAQAQDDSVRWIRWQLYNANDLINPIDDTNVIYTPVTTYSYNGLFNEQNFVLKCTIETESNVQVINQLQFNVAYEAATYGGDFSVKCLCREDCNLLQWDALSVIPGTANPENGYSFDNDTLVLQDSATVSWDEVYDEQNQPEDMDFQNPWTAIWKGACQGPELTQTATVEFPGISNVSRPYVIKYSPDGQTAVVGGYMQGTAWIYTVNSDGSFSAPVQIMGEDGAALSGTVFDAAFNADGTALILVGTPGALLYSVSGKTVTFKQVIAYGTTNLVSSRAVAFHPTSGTFAIGDIYITTERTGLYWFTLQIGTNGEMTVTAGGMLALPEGTERNANVYGLTFRPDGSMLVATGNFSGGVLAYNVSSETHTPHGTLQGISISPSVTSIDNWWKPSFNPSGDLLAFSSNIPNTATLIYTVAPVESGWDFTYLTNLFGRSASFSRNGDYLLSGATLYYVDESGTSPSFTSLGNISLDHYVPQYSTLVYSTAFSPTTDSFICGFSSTASELIPSVIENVTSPEEETLFTITYPTGNVVVTKNGMTVTATSGGLSTTAYLSSIEADEAVIALTPSSLMVYSFEDGVYSGTDQTTWEYTQLHITSATLTGPQRCDYFAIVDGDGTNILSSLSSPTFIPSWSASAYDLDLYAGFRGTLDGGTGTSTGSGFRIYRAENEGTALKEIATLPSTTTQLKDFGLKSGVSYTYYFYVYDADGAFMGVVESEPIQRRFKRYSLLATSYNPNDGCYHVVKEYQFAANIQNMTVSNNNSPTFSANFTPYPTRFGTTSNYASGTLQALIGFIDYTAYKYFDSAELMDELNALSTTPYVLFLKDMKGHLRMVSTGGAIQQTPEQKTLEMQVTISLPWTEIGDADKFSVIQVPTDAGWNKDQQVLDVKLEVNPETGVLSVVYPDSYYGTTFKMSGLHLLAETPDGVTPAQFNLAPTASATTDGELKATIQD